MPGIPSGQKFLFPREGRRKSEALGDVLGVFVFYIADFSGLLLRPRPWGESAKSFMKALEMT